MSSQRTKSAIISWWLKCLTLLYICLRCMLWMSAQRDETNKQNRNDFWYVNTEILFLAGQTLFLGDVSNGNVYESRGRNSGTGYRFSQIRNRNSTHIMLNSFHRIEMKKATSPPCQTGTGNAVTLGIKYSEYTYFDHIEWQRGVVEAGAQTAICLKIFRSVAY